MWLALGKSSNEGIWLNKYWAASGCQAHIINLLYKPIIAYLVVPINL
jgi:hypothetical protein